MRRRLLFLAVPVLLALAPAPAAAKSPAVCGPGDRPEPGLQGQVPAATQGDESRKGFSCNMRLVGHTDIDNRGANYGLAWIGDCAYVSSFRATGDADPAGLAVIDVADPRRPKPVEYHRSAGSSNAVETIHAREAPGRKVLVTGAYDGNWLDVYDVSGDCRRPKQKASFQVPHNIHNITLDHEAKLVYVATALPTSETNHPEPHLYVVDIENMAAPKIIASVNMATLVPQGADAAPLGVHRVDVSKDGRRVYAGVITATILAPLAKPLFTGGEMTILDASEIVARKPNAQFKFISKFESGFHGPRWFKTGGRTYLVSGDEAVNNSYPATSCGGPFPEIGDITDEKKPKPVGQFELEINRANACPEALRDGLLYSTHYTDVDDQEDAALGLFPMYNAGLRIADIRDPANPKEVGYFNPPTDRDTKFGATYGNPGKGDVIDLTPTNIRYRPETGHIWMASISSGFRVVELTPTGGAAALGLPASDAPRPSAGAAPSATKAPRCRRSLRISVRAPRGARLRWARIHVNGKRRRTLRGRDLRVPVTLRRLPAGKVRVTIVARTRAGRRIVSTRRYVGCGRR